MCRPWTGAKRVAQMATLLWLPVVAADGAEIPCGGLRTLSIPVTAIGLPSRGATVQMADEIVAVGRTIGPDGVVTPASPDYCKVVGTVAPIDPSAPPITFQVNLPAAWNGKALQYGGGGFNGTLVTGVGPALDAPPSVATPLAQGYRSVVAKLGQTAVDRFMRLYVTAGVNHGGSGVSGTTGEPIPQYVDLLGVLDRWVERSEAPRDLVQTSVEADPPFKEIASRPMCSFPRYPRYRGAGDPKAASSFTCETR